MSDDSMYISTHEAALALVATSMKKARLRIDTLIVNSILGGILFTIGGMFHVIIQSNMPDAYSQNPAVVELLQAACYPIGLFYVVILGTELFNSNILFFSVGVMRGAVSVVDLIISWIVSWWLNLVSNIFVAYVFCKYSGVFTSDSVITGSQFLLDYKMLFLFHQTLLKGIAGIGFTHSVADMFVLVMGLINGSKYSVGHVAWKVLLPGAIGNMIGGSFFGIAIPWYSHIYSVEKDQRILNLPRYDLRDEQPEINTDSRVVKQRSNLEQEVTEKPSDTSNSVSIERYSPPVGLYDDNDSLSRASGLQRVTTSRTSNTIHKVKSKSQSIRSPKNVFPVYGMGVPMERERSIASGNMDDAYYSAADADNSSAVSYQTDGGPNTSAEYVGSRIRKIISRRLLHSANESEKHELPSHYVPPPMPSRPSAASLSSRNMRQYSISSNRSFRNNAEAQRNRMHAAGVSHKAMEHSDYVAGSSPTPVYSTAPIASTSLLHSQSLSKSLSPNQSLESVHKK